MIEREGGKEIIFIYIKKIYRGIDRLRQRVIDRKRSKEERDT